MGQSNPQSVTDLAATVVSINEIDLSWVNSESNGCRVERTIPLASGQSGGPTNFQTLAVLAAGVTEYVDDTVQAGSVYTYRVSSLPGSVIFIPDNGVTVSAVTPGAVQPHLDASQPSPVGAGNQFSYKDPVILDGTATSAWANASDEWDAPIVDPSVNGIPFNS